MGMKIKKIEQLDVVEPAYDLCVADEEHTFPLSSGVYVHNSLRVPKQYFGFTEDGAGFNGGQSLSIISSRYAKMIKRIQNTIVQMLTDAINIILIDRGLPNYINRFKLKMLAPTTQEEIDRRENIAAKVQLTSDTMSMMDLIDDNTTKLKILKSLIKSYINDTEVIQLIQDEIDKLENQTAEEESTTSEETEESEGSEDMDLESSIDVGGLDAGDEGGGGESLSASLGLGGEEEESEEALPTPDQLGADFTDNSNF